MTRFLVAALLLAVGSASAEKQCEGTKFYTFMFMGRWTDSTVGYPGFPDAKFSEVVGFSHASNEKGLFEIGAQASTELKGNIQKENVQDLLLAVANRYSEKTALDFSQSPTFFFAADMPMYLRLKVDSEHPSVTFLTALRPTGRYFAGVDSLNLCDTETGEWRKLDALEMPVYDIDAETGVVSKLKCGDGFLCNSGDVPTILSVDIFEQPCFGTNKYTLKFTANWTRDAQPLLFPWNAKFSKLMAVSHSDSFSLFEEGEFANSGLQTLSEEASFRGMYEELEHEKDLGHVNEYVVEGDRPKNKGGFTIYPLGPSLLTVTVDSHNRFISFAAKIVPSADWFIGADSIDMCDEANGRWKRFEDANSNPKLQIKPYDAGSLEAKDFAGIRNGPLPDEDEVIREVKCGTVFCEGDGEVPPLGYAYIFSANTDPFVDGTAEAHEILHASKNSASKSHDEL